MLLLKVYKNKIFSFFEKPFFLVLFKIDPLAHTIPAAFYRNINRDLIIEYVPTKLG